MSADAANLLAGGVGALPAKTLKIDVPKFAIIWYLETNPSSAGGLVTVKSVCVCVGVCVCVCGGSICSPPPRIKWGGGAPVPHLSTLLPIVGLHLALHLREWSVYKHLYRYRPCNISDNSRMSPPPPPGGGVLGIKCYQGCSAARSDLCRGLS